MKAIWALIKETASKWNDLNAPRLGAALAFYTMLSAAPLLVISVSIAGLVFGQRAAAGRIVAELSGLIGQQGAAVIQQLLDNAHHLSSGILALILGVLLLLFGASSVFGELRDCLNLVWGINTVTGPGLIGLVKYRFVAFIMVMGIGFLLLGSLIFSAAIAAAGSLITRLLPVSGPMLAISYTLFSWLAITALFALLYKVVPEVHVEWKDVWIGAAVTSALFSLGKVLIGLYIGKAGVASTYGAAGSLVAFLIWVYYSAQLFLLGAEFTHAFSEKHGSRARARANRAATQDQVVNP